MVDRRATLACTLLLPLLKRSFQRDMHSPEHKSSTGDFFPALDGIRGCAILSVVIFHLAYFNPASPIQNLLFSFTKAGFMGVPVFFVLSGFLISYLVIKTQDEFSAIFYAFRRASKILPPFLISLFLFSLLALVWKNPKNIWLSAAAYLLTLPNFTSGWDGINPVYWSLMVEMHFYIIFPIMFFLIRKFSTRPELWCALILLAVPTSIRLLHHLPLDTHKEMWFCNAQMFPRALDNFTFGILFAHICINKNKYKPLVRKSALLTYIGVCILLISYFLCGIVNYLLSAENPYSYPNRLWVFEIFRLLPAMGTFFLLFCIFLPKNNLIIKILMYAPLRYVGLISYEWFLFHYPPAQYLAHLIGQSEGSLTLYLSKTLIPFIVTFVFAALLYHFVSNPVIMRAKKIKF